MCTRLSNGIAAGRLYGRGHVPQAPFKCGLIPFLERLRVITVI